MVLHWQVPGLGLLDGASRCPAVRDGDHEAISVQRSDLAARKRGSTTKRPARSAASPVKRQLAGLGKPAKSAALDDLRPRHHRATEGGRTRLGAWTAAGRSGTRERSTAGCHGGSTIGAVEQYVIRGGGAGYDRLCILARARSSDTSDLLARVGLRSGMRCLDLGCGGGEVTFEIARLVGQDGSVIGVDMDEVKLELARVAAAERGQANVEFRLANVNEWHETPHMTLSTAGSCSST